MFSSYSGISTKPESTGKVYSQLVQFLKGLPNDQIKFVQW